MPAVTAGGQSRAGRGGGVFYQSLTPDHPYRLHSGAADPRCDAMQHDGRAICGRRATAANSVKALGFRGVWRLHRAAFRIAQFL
jgi:hypothetical protein